MSCRLPSSSAHGILQARILEWVSISSSRGSSQLRDRTRISLLYDLCLYLQRLSDILLILSEVTVAQLCLTLCDPVDCSPSASSAYGMVQARILEWVAISFARGSSQPRDRTQVSHIAGRRFNLCTTERNIKMNIQLSLKYCQSFCDFTVGKN